MDAPHVPIKKNAKYPLEVPIISKGVQVSGNSFPNLLKLSFYDHYLIKYLEFKLQNYMDTTCVVEGGPIELVPMEWDRGL